MVKKILKVDLNFPPTIEQDEVEAEASIAPAVEGATMPEGQPEDVAEMTATIEKVKPKRKAAAKKVVEPEPVIEPVSEVVVRVSNDLAPPSFLTHP